ncbi:MULTISPECIES: cytochrome P450 [unclassified Nocardia]|uniref:cytochrome P450 n=1 Tax=unclassified Nocardia TaxID=2637762 RepID=UPI001CE4417E|nr:MULTISPECIES: cytochrome P450 [unclassified Nocardia]
MTTGVEVRDYPFGTPGHPEVYALFARLRREEPVSRIRLPYGGEAWLVTRYDDAKAVLADRRFSRAAVVGRDDIPRIIPAPAPGNSLLSMDPPEHTRVRTLIGKVFTPRRIEGMRPRIQEIVDGLLTAMMQAGPSVDLVASLALPLPVIVICEILGVPEEDQYRFREFSGIVMSTTAHTREEIVAARMAFKGYLAELISQRRRHPTDDLLGALVCARDGDDRLSEEELVDLGVVLLLAGHESTANQIASFVYALLTAPQEWERMCSNLKLVPAAVEELLRYLPVGAGGSFARVALEDVTVGEVTVRAGESVFVNLQAANRDETVFDGPENLDLARSNNPHMAFGYGLHRCVGAQLARMELQIALASLLERFPGLHLAVSAAEVPWKAGMLVHGPRALPVSW